MSPLASVHHRSRRSRVLVAIAIVALSLLAAAPAAEAQSVGRADRPRIVVTGRVEVRSGERSKAVVIFDGPAVIDGRVDGAVVVFNGDARISGRVTDDVVVLKGRAILASGARVEGDVLSSKKPVVPAGAKVDGEVRSVNFANAFREVGWVLWFAWWLALGVATLLTGFLLLWLVPRGVDAALAAGRERVGPAIGWGLAIAIGVPIISVVLLVTLVGSPLGLAGLFALGLIYLVGYAMAVLLLGRRILKPPRSIYLALLVGWAILRVVDLIPVLGNLVTAAATVFGLGALAVAGWRAGHREPAGATWEPEAAAPPPGGAPF